MKKLQEIARRLRRPEEQLRLPVDLIQQGYEPNYLANYRPDELGGVDELTLSAVKRAIKTLDAIEDFRIKTLKSFENDATISPSAKEVIQNATSIAQMETAVRYLRTRKNAKNYAEKMPVAALIGEAVLTTQGEPPSDFPLWVAQKANVPVEQVEEVIAGTKQWLTHLLSEDIKLVSDLQRFILSRGSVSLKILPEPAKGSEAEKQIDAQEDAIATGQMVPAVNAIASSPVSEPAMSFTSEPISAEASLIELNSDKPVNAEADLLVPADSQQTTSSESTPLAATNLKSDGSSLVEETPLIAGFNQGKKSSKPIRTKSLSDKQLSPRQRRRRWIRNILESYSKLKKPLGELTPFQILMISRGLRSQIIQLNFQYDKKQLIQKCREALCPGRHPMHSFLVQVAEYALDHHLLPRIHQDVIAILEEFANEELTEAAVAHLQGLLLQRPLRGHRILIIDAVGPKMAPLAIIDTDGEVIFAGELPCNSNRADIVAQSVVALGQLVHEHRVTLIAMSNGPSRRYLMHPVRELLKQSTDGSLYWAMVDRAGADAYCNSRICLVELPNISRRHRAAVWLGRRLQDPLRQILKVDPTRLRLGSYQREIPQAELEIALRDAVSSAISKSGLDVFASEPEVLQRAPGMTLAAANAIAKARLEERITNRETLMTVLKENLTEMQARQAIGFLRVHGSNNPLDATSIHPDDYRLAQRLIEHAKLPAPPNCPDGWVKPDFKKLAEANKAAEKQLEEQRAEFGAVPETDSAEMAENEPFTLAVESEEIQSTSDGSASASIEGTTDSSSTNQTLDSSMASADQSQGESQPESREALPNETVSAGNQNDRTGGDEPATLSIPSFMPTIDKAPFTRQPLAIDVERLARSWQVGREKLKRVAMCLQYPFADDREFRYPVALISKMPELKTIAVGDMFQAIVVSVMNFGVFADIGPDCSGLIHISRLSDNYLEDPHQHVQTGDLLNVWVVNVDREKNRLGLSVFPPGSQPQRERHEDRRADSRRESGSQRDRSHPGHSQGPGASHRSGSGQNRRERPERIGAGQNRSDRSRTEGQDRPQNDRGGGGHEAPNRSRNDKFRGDRPQSGRPRNDRRNDRSRPDRDRERDEEPTESKRSAKVQPLKPVTPITEAMQQGKEPMRSFSDLLQFMKKDKPADPIIPSTLPIEPEGGTTVIEPPSSTPSSPVLADGVQVDQDPPSISEAVGSDANDTQSGPVA